MRIKGDDVKLSDFDFDLPEDLIALHPPTERRDARLLVRASGGDISLSTVADLMSFLQPGDHLVFNDTRVIPARLTGRRLRGTTEARVEVTLITPKTPTRWSALARPAKKCRPGDTIRFSDSLSAEVVENSGNGEVVLAFAVADDDLMTALERVGTMPLPPYIASKRAPDASDKERYQTVFARQNGAIAAPTASLHFDAELLENLANAGITHSFVTLHVGIGTFMPVKVDRIDDHQMHAEWGSVTAAAAAEINAAQRAGGRIIPVGTTALRLIETVADDQGQMRQWEGDTDIFITPGYRFKITDGLMTNFHLPKSTLLMLVAALIGRDEMMAVYDRAIAERFRVFSYGDSSLLFPDR